MYTVSFHIGSCIHIVFVNSATPPIPIDSTITNIGYAVSSLFFEHTYFHVFLPFHKIWKLLSLLIPCQRQTQSHVVSSIPTTLSHQVFK